MNAEDIWPGEEPIPAKPKETVLDKSKKIEDPEELVWIDDGFSDIIAIYGTEWGQPHYIRYPVQKKRKDVNEYQTILTSKAKKLYDNCIDEVETRRKLKAKS